ncbi:hypothetical protein GALL_496180 [mine drainage metagenome]|uniref:Uncharacterized protein n=1 Tax=mine drainage metagenome TaxID=410659 RepID=A0A1J5PLW2_9ZZZZ
MSFDDHRKRFEQNRQSLARLIKAANETKGRVLPLWLRVCPSEEVKVDPIGNHHGVPAVMVGQSGSSFFADCNSGTQFLKSGNKKRTCGIQRPTSGVRRMEGPDNRA